MPSIWSFQLHAISFPHRISSNILQLRRTELGNDCGYLNYNNRRKSLKIFVSSAKRDDNNGIQDETIKSEKYKLLVEAQSRIGRLQESISSLTPLIFWTKRTSTSNIAVGLCIAAMFLVIVVRAYTARNSRSSRPGSVADLVRRGQLRSDRRGISSPLKYDDPFDNPMVKVGKTNSTVEMCGKVYRLAPVTLTREQQTVHQKRRSQAYEWKRPTIFLKEGDAIPPDVDPDTVRWIPANHPFATTVSDIDEDLAQNNVYQKHGVPFRIQAEHEALQRKLESLQSEQKLNKLEIDPGAAKNFERPFKSKLKTDDQVEDKPSNGQSRPTRLDLTGHSLGSNTTSEEIQQA